MKSPMCILTGGGYFLTTKLSTKLSREQQNLQNYIFCSNAMPTHLETEGNISAQID